MTLLLHLILVAMLTASPRASTHSNSSIPDDAPVVTITYVQTPWYAFRWLLHYGFRKAVPEYQAISGLQYKFFSHTQNADTFGGIYQWRSASDARRQFAPTWFARVKEKYGVAGRVDYYTLVRIVEPTDASFVAGSQESDGQATVIPRASEALLEAIARPHAGLMRTYVVEQNGQTGLILLFANAQARMKFAATTSLGVHSILDTPILLKN